MAGAGRIISRCDIFFEDTGVGPGVPPGAWMSPGADFSADRRLVLIAAIAVGVGAVATGAAFVLFRSICLFTNLFFYQRAAFTVDQPGGADLGWLAVLPPVAGGFAVGLLARYGSERIRGHGIPEAMEAILIGRSRMGPKIALLKPLSSAIAIGSGGPFGAEGPIIMTGGAFGSLAAQLLLLTADEDVSIESMMLLDGQLSQDKWPHVIGSRDGGHALPDSDIQTALTFFSRTEREGWPLSPPVTTRPPRPNVPKDAGVDAPITAPAEPVKEFPEASAPSAPAEGEDAGE